jgi:hypothetical protein
MIPADSARDAVPWVNSVFEQPWWLDAVAPGLWDEVLIRQGTNVVARLPYVRVRRYGLETIVQPQLTQTLGPWLAPVDGSYVRRLSVEKERLTALIELLPRVDHFHMNFSPTLTNWLPFHWAGFQASARCTYRIDDLSDLDRVWGEFDPNVRRIIRKASALVRVEPDHPLEELLRLDAMTWARQGMRPPVSPALIQRLDAACAAHGARRILSAVDAKGRTHSTLLVVWDERSLYAIVNGRNPEFQAIGSNALLYWEAIRLAAEVAQAFDFEGSMLEPVEHYIRGFGGRQTPYLSVSRTGARARAALAIRAASHRVGRR